MKKIKLQKKFEKQKTEMKLDFALQASKIGTWEIAVPDMTVSFDGNLARLFGMEKDIPTTLQGWMETFKPYLEPRMHEQFFDYLQFHFEEELRPEFANLKYTFPDNRIIYTENHIKVIYDDRKKPTYIIGSVRDITADTTRIEKMEHELKQAEAANDAKSTFLSLMSHEIRTPLSIITGMTRIAKQETDEEKLEEHLKKIDIASNNLLLIVNDVLDMSKIEAEKMEIFEDTFDLKKTISEIYFIMSQHSEGKSQKLTVTYENDLPQYILGDEFRIRQIITNLISNAIKFTPNDGEIMVRVGADYDNKDFLSLKVSVEDNGIGIAPERQERMFQPYEQASAYVSTKYGGTGLGLAICKRIVNLMEGEITLSSELGKGSVFSFTIKVKYVNKELEASLASKESSNQRRVSYPEKRILIAEDNEINCEIIVSLLKEFEVQLQVATNGREALEFFQNDPEKYDLIFMDVQMPIMDGYEATQRIRACAGKEAGEIPIIAMTANVFRQDIEKCLEMGMDDHIGKPIDVEILRSKMSKYLA